MYLLKMIWVLLVGWPSILNKDHMCCKELKKKLLTMIQNRLR
ncbi:Uncharacterised protein [Mycobacteroides abscessus subsp. abscessus]|nr:Uncharacterised protein [Mycobacteroides abscessus subsp. abscessus]